MQPARIARWFDTESNSIVKCLLCPHLCRIKPGNSGICGVRLNENGTLIAASFGKVAALHIDPIEKKPLYHFFPGSKILSIGSVGCNLECAYCQNHDISQADLGTYQIAQTFSPDDMVSEALSHPDNIGIAYTYNEPLVWFEYMLETAKAAQLAGLKNVMVTNGFINEAPLAELLPVIDAFSVDLKGFSESFYLKITGGALAPVLNSLKQIRLAGKHLEIVNLVIPQLNDNETEFEAMIQWIADELGQETILHLSRYFPRYRLGIEPTSIYTLDKLAEIARKKLDFVYVGNVQSEYSDTRCPVCKKVLITRQGYSVSCHGLDRDGNCNSCNYKFCER
jgi:pyruvate formate lyase activating enzyme